MLYQKLGAASIGAMDALATMLCHELPKLQESPKLHEIQDLHEHSKFHELH